MYTPKLPLILALAFALLSGVAQAAPTDPDRRFGTDGSATLDAGGTDLAESLALQPDGRIVVVGVAAKADTKGLAVRLDQSGSPDQTFAPTGLFTGS